ncbi:MAG: response regulator [Chloroflexi bacterium]|nr:response regulator [Chloroflexota bacterium]
MALGAGLTVRVLLGGMAPWQVDVLRGLLAADPGIAIVGTAADAEGTVGQAAALGPDVVLLNFYICGLSGLETTRRLRGAAPKTRVVLLGDEDAEVYVSAARAAGGSAYLPWLTSRRALLAAVRQDSGTAAGQVGSRPPAAIGRASGASEE